MPKVIGCINCGYRSENQAEIDLFILNGCKCQEERIGIKINYTDENGNKITYIGKGN